MNIEHILDSLIKYKEKRATIELDKLSELISSEYIEVFNTVGELEKLGYLAVYSSDTNRKPKPLYKRYRITIDDNKVINNEDRAQLLHELNYSIYFKFNIDSYKEDLDLYKKHRVFVLLLSDYFKEKREYFGIEYSINERSFEIFRDEKFLRENPLAREVLKTVDLSIGDLNVYYTPEPFFCHTAEQISNSNILIVENKDTFYTIKKLFIEGKTTILGVDFSTVIYGEGKKIISSFEDITYNKNLAYLNSRDNQFYYWGDIDKEGVWIYEGLQSRYKDFNIKLFNAAYYKMLNMAEIKDIQKTKKPQKVKPRGITELSREACRSIDTILKEDKYIPQEIISYRVLRED